MEKVFITDKQGNKVLPKTHISAVYDDEGNDLGSHLGAFEDEVRGLVDTPHQEYITVATYASLPASGSKDTIYRVSNYNGSTSQVDTTSYSEYAWDGSQYIFLCVKSQIGEVFDISAYHNNAKYADLNAALTSNTGGVPQSLQKGGMSVKFIQSSDNKYVQYRLMSNSFNTTVANWQGVDDEPTVGSDNLVKSGGVFDSIYQLSRVVSDEVNLNNGVNTVDAQTSQYGLNLIKTRISHVKEIKYKAHIGTTYFYVVNYTGKYVYKSQLIVTETNSVEGEIKTINVDVELKTGQYIAIGGAIYYEQLGLLDGAESVFGTFDSVAPSSDNRFLSYSLLGEIEQETQDEINNSLFYKKVFGDVKSLATEGSVVTTTSTVFVQKDKNHVDRVRKIKFISCVNPIYFYKVKIVNNKLFSYTLITSFTPTAQDNRRIVTLDVDIRLDKDEYIGVNGQFLYTGNSNFDAFYGSLVPGTTFDSAHHKYFFIIEGYQYISNSPILASDNQFASGTWRPYGRTTEGNYGLQVTQDELLKLQSILIELNCPTTNVTDYLYSVIVYDQNGTWIDVAIMGKQMTQKVMLENLREICDVYRNAYYFRIYFSYVPNSSLTAFPNDTIITIAPTNTKSTIIVDAQGNGDYISLQEALDSLGDSVAYPRTIILLPGIYEMDITTQSGRFALGFRNLSIIGTNKNSCIIRCDKGVYTVSPYVDSAPLKLAGNCYLANLTIISTGDDYDSEEYGVGNNNSYCIHIDFPALENDRITINNCRFYNNHSACIGIGLRKKFTVEVTNCEFINPLENPGANSCSILCHESSDAEVGETLILRNNTIKTTANYGVKVSSAYDGNIYLDLVQNVIDAAGDGFSYDSTKHIKSNLCFGNNIEAMNK